MAKTALIENGKRNLSSRFVNITAARFVADRTLTCASSAFAVSASGNTLMKALSPVLKKQAGKSANSGRRIFANDYD